MQCGRRVGRVLPRRPGRVPGGRRGVGRLVGAAARGLGDAGSGWVPNSVWARGAVRMPRNRVLPRIRPGAAVASPFLASRWRGPAGSGVLRSCGPTAEAPRPGAVGVWRRPGKPGDAGARSRARARRVGWGPVCARRDVHEGIARPTGGAPGLHDRSAREGAVGRQADGLERRRRRAVGQGCHRRRPRGGARPRVGLRPGFRVVGVLLRCVISVVFAPRGTLTPAKTAFESLICR